MRLIVMIRLYEWSSRVYAHLFKWNKQPWGLKKSDLLEFERGSLGHALGEFYKENGFDIMPKLENHDAFHVLTGIGTDIKDEIAMQYLLLGNGKRSLYLFAMVFIGSMLYPEHFKYFLASFRKGKQCQPFYALEFRYLLDYSLETLKGMLMHSHVLQYTLSK